MAVNLSISMTLIKLSKVTLMVVMMTMIHFVMMRVLIRRILSTKQLLKILPILQQQKNSQPSPLQMTNLKSFKILKEIPLFKNGRTILKSQISREEPMNLISSSRIHQELMKLMRRERRMKRFKELVIQKVNTTVQFGVENCHQKKLLMINQHRPLLHKMSPMTPMAIWNSDPEEIPLDQQESSQKTTEFQFFKIPTDPKMTLMDTPQYQPRGRKDKQISPLLRRKTKIRVKKEKNLNPPRRSLKWSRTVTRKSLSRTSTMFCKNSPVQKEKQMFPCRKIRKSSLRKNKIRCRSPPKSLKAIYTRKMRTPMKYSSLKIMPKNREKILPVMDLPVNKSSPSFIVIFKFCSPLFYNDCSYLYNL